MNITSVACALVPPLLAIAIELLNPIGEDKAEQNADTVLDKLPDSLRELFDLGFAAGVAGHTNPPALPLVVPVGANQPTPQDVQIFQDVRRDLVSCTVTAAELSGLLPTLIAAVLTAFAVFAELADPLVPLMLYVAIVVIVALFIYKSLSGRDFRDIAETGPSIWGWNLRFTYLKMVSWVIYLVNVLLLSVAVAVFLHVGCDATAQMTEHSVTKSQGSERRPAEFKVPQRVCKWFAGILD